MILHTTAIVKAWGIVLLFMILHTTATVKVEISTEKYKIVIFKLSQIAFSVDLLDV